MECVKGLSLPQPSVELVPTRENAAQLLFSLLAGSLRIPHECGAIPPSARSASFDSLMRQMIFH
jgi:hypothetical protein